jgi:hypothetical protein
MAFHQPLKEVRPVTEASRAHDAQDAACLVDREDLHTRQCIGLEYLAASASKINVSGPCDASLAPARAIAATRRRRCRSPVTSRNATTIREGSLDTRCAR